MPTVNIAPYIRNQYFTDNGIPLAGGLLNCYNGGSAGGTGDRKDTYSDAAGTVLNANPIVLDAAGRAKIYLKSGPYLFVLTDSTGAVIWSEDGVSNLSVTTSVNTMSDLRALVAGSASIIRTLGYGAINDGGGWWYYWSASSSARHDGGMVIQPSSLPATGRWIGFKPSDKMLNLRVYGALCDGATDDSVEILLCDSYCKSNGCAMIVDSSVYYNNASYFPTSRIILKPSVRFLYPYATFQLSLNVDIDTNDNTQHFVCSSKSDEVVLLSGVSDFVPEWFGETYSSHPITSTCLHFSTLVSRIICATEINPTETGGDGSLVVNGNVSTSGMVEAGIVESSGWVTADTAIQSGDPDIVGSIAAGRVYGESVQSSGDATISGSLRHTIESYDSTAVADAVGGGVAMGGEYNSGGSKIVFAGISGVKANATDGNTAGELHFSVRDNGAALADAGMINQYGNMVLNNDLSVRDSGGGAYFLSTSVSESLVKVEANLRIGHTNSVGVVVGQPTGGSKGGGTINAVAVYDDNILLTGYVLDKAFNKKFKISEWDKKAKGKKHRQAREFVSTRKEFLDVENHSTYIEKNRTLPTFSDIEASQEIPSTGDMIQRLWEVVEMQAVHIKQLNDRIKILESKMKGA